MASTPASDRVRAHRSPTRLLAAGVVAVTVLAGCGSSGPRDHQSAPSTTMASGTTAGPTTSASTTEAPTTLAPTTVSTSPPTTSATAAADAAWPAFAATHGAGTQRSSVELTSAGPYGAVSFNVQGQGTTPHVVVAHFTGSAWSTVADLSLDVGGEVEASGTPITVVHLTGAPTPDFAVTVNYNGGNALALASAVGGTWHLLHFSGGSAGASAEQDEVVDATITGQAVTQSSNDCVPDCASGHQVSTTFSYSAQSGTMIAVG